MSERGDLAGLVRDRAGAEPPVYGLVLGPGLSHLLAQVEGTAIPYADLPGFPAGGPAGAARQLCIGTLEGRRVAVFGGRSHYHENGRADGMRLPLELLTELGCDRVILTDAAASLRADIPPGGLMLVSDHIALTGANPLIGATDDRRFVPMGDSHDPGIRADLRAAARAEDIALPEGVYCWLPGPSSETPAEGRAARVLGSDAVGMSTVPEVILARYLGLRCAAVAVIAGMGAGLGGARTGHDDAQTPAAAGAARLERLLRRFLRD